MATTLKIDEASAEKMLAASVAPKMAYEDGRATTTQATDRQTGAPLWRITVFVMSEDASRAPETLSVTVPAAVAPALAQLQHVVFTGLRVMLWSGGASLRADSVQAVSPDSAPTAAFLSDIDVAGGE